MLKNYLLIAKRYLLRYKSYTAINVLGLAVGVTCCILILLFVRSEFSYDRWNSKAARTYRLWETVKFPDQTVESAVTELPAGPAIAASFPSVEATCRVYGFSTLVRKGNTSFTENITVVDTSLFRIFDFNLEKGNPDHPFPPGRSVLLTPELAKKYFGGQDPIGQRLELQLGDSLQPFTVGGIVQPAPEESSVKFGMLISFANDRSLFTPRMLTSWFNIFTETYVLLKEGQQAANVEKGFPAMMKQQLGKDYNGNPVQHLQPLTDVHLNTRLGGVNQPSSDPKYSYVLISIGALILLVACINFITLSIGRSTTRAIEVGVRKALGAGRRQLIAQFWGEAFLLSAVSVILGFLFALSLLPAFNQLIDRHLVFHADGVMIGSFAGLAVVIAGVAGSYPAFVLSGFRPVEVLKGKVSVGNRNGGLLGKGLVVGQFLASIVLLTCTLLMSKQMDFLQRKDLGFNKDQVIIVPTNKGRAPGFALAKLYMGELNKYPQVVASTVSTFSFAEGGWASLGFTDDHKQHHTIQYNEVDDRFVEAMQIQVLKGRSFAVGNAADTNNSILVNEALVKEYGLKDPIGKRFGVYTQRIVGVMKDFNYESLHTAVKPLVLSLKFDTIAHQGIDVSFPNATQPRLSIRMKGNLAENIELLKKAWAAVAPRQQFEYHFLDQTLARSYEVEQKSSAMVRIASGLSIFIACMGLFGLATLTVSRRTKELGVRKVLGAGTFRLVRLLSYEFIGLVAIAAVIATPIAAWAMNAWLKDFAYRTDLSWWIFALAGGAALVIALGTISFQTIRAANANPADSLRTE